MFKQSELQQVWDSPFLLRRVSVGAGIALTFITLFLMNVGEPDPNWHRLWFLRPLIIVPLAGACGGLCYHAMDHFRSQRGWNKIGVTLFSVIVYIIGSWMGFVLGLAGTLWD